MSKSAADLTLAEAKAGLARVRKAIAAWEETGVVDYGIEDRRGRLSINDLRERETYYVNAIRRLEGNPRRMSRAVPVDLR